MLSYTEFLESVQAGGDRSPRSSTRSKADEYDNAKKSALKKTQYRGWTIHPSLHAASQAHDRRRDYTEDHWKSIHRKAVEHYDAGEKKHGYHVVYSKSKEQGYVMHADPKKKIMHVVTVLPKGKYHAKEGTHQLHVESVDLEIVGYIEVE